MASNQSSAPLFPPGYLEEYNGQVPVSVAIVFTVLEVVCVVLRFWARTIGKIAWGADDTLIIFGAILSLTVIGCCLGERCLNVDSRSYSKRTLSADVWNRRRALWRCWISFGNFRPVLSFDTYRLGKIRPSHPHGVLGCDCFPKTGYLSAVPPLFYQTHRSNRMLGYWSSNGRELCWKCSRRILSLYSSRVPVEQNHSWGALSRYKCVVSLGFAHEHYH